MQVPEQVEEADFISGFTQQGFEACGIESQGIHYRWRHHAGGVIATYVDSLHRVTA